MEILFLTFIVYSIIKILYTFGINKLFTAKPVYAEMTAEKYINYINARTLRSCEVECQYAKTRYLFNQALKSGELDRCKILAIRTYLEKHVKKTPIGVKFENDAHFIYCALKSPSIRKKDFIVVENIIMK